MCDRRFRKRSISRDTREKRCVPQTPKMVPVQQYILPVCSATQRTHSNNSCVLNSYPRGVAPPRAHGTAKKTPSKTEKPFRHSILNPQFSPDPCGPAVSGRGCWPRWPAHSRRPGGRTSAARRCGRRSLLSPPAPEGRKNRFDSIRRGVYSTYSKQTVHVFFFNKSQALLPEVSVFLVDTPPPLQCLLTLITTALLV